MKKKTIAVVALVLLAACSQAREKPPPSPVLATVNGVPITAAQFKDRLKFLDLGYVNISSTGANGGEAKVELLSQVIEEEMYNQEAAKLGIKVSDAEVDQAVKRAESDYQAGGFEAALRQGGLTLEEYRAEIYRKKTAEKLIESQAYSGVKVSTDEARRYYDRHRKDFKRPEMARARQIVVDDPKVAASLLAELKKGADFAALARARSFSPDSASGGDLGYFSRGQMPPEFERVVFKMKPGQTSGVVKTPYGYHIFRVEAVRKASDPTFDEVQLDVRKLLAQQAGEDSFAKWQDALKARSKIEVNFDVLGKL